MKDENDRWSQLEALFHSACDLPPEQRLDYLRAECVDDPSLFDEVAPLIGAETHISELEAAVRTQRDSTVGDDAYDRWIGSRIGAFEVKERIGRGGMGVVYRGERRGKLTQDVAIKLMSMDLASPFARERFLRERDTLAGLQHRNIVRLIDGGMTEDGFPYLAMEHVRGRRIDAVCDDPATSVGQIIVLMLQVCEAVSYVHRNLFLHRDLKPGNVLVTEENLVKLLDFGTFKSLVPADRTLTQPGMQALTVRYASPEHLRGGEISTASDVFSLGMMLYRLLLGRLPERWDDLSIDRYLDALAREKIDGIVQQLRQRRQIGSQVARDLEAIIRKALRFEPAERYRDADALSADLRAAMEGRPITVLPMTQAERAIRFFRRNRAALVLSSFTLVLLIAGVVLMLRGREMIRAEERHAQTGLRDETRLTHFLLVDYFEQLKRIPGSTEAQRQAVSQALGYVDSLSAVAGMSDLQVDRVQAYTEMGSLLGNPYENNLGETARAIQTLQKAVDLAQKLVIANPGNQKYKQMDATANLALGRTYFGNGDPHRAEVYLLNAVNENRDIIETGRNLDSAILSEAAAAVDGLGDVYDLDGAVTLHKPEEALRRYKEAQALDVRGRALDPACSRCQRGIAVEYWKIGLVVGDPEQGARMFEAGLRAIDALPPGERISARVQRVRSLILQNLGTSYLAMGRRDDGMRILNRVRADLQRLVAADQKDERAHFDLYGLDFNTAEFLDLIGTRAEVLALDQELVTQADALVRLNPTNPVFRSHKAAADLRLGMVEVRYGDRARGEALERQAAQIMVTIAHNPDADADLLQTTADALVATHGDGSLAVRCAQQALAKASEPSSSLYISLANAELLAGNFAAARSAATKAAAAAGSGPNIAAQANARRAQSILHADTLRAAETRTLLNAKAQTPRVN